MTAPAPSDGEVAVLQQKIALLEQGMGQAARIRELWAKSVRELKETKAELKQSLQQLADAHSELTEKNNVLEHLNGQLREEMAFREKVEAERLLSQKLESIGQLAAGIAHEINTPIQFIGDNARFLQTAFDGLQQLLVALDPEHRAEEGTEATRLAAVFAAADAGDLLGIAEDVPDAIAESLEGLDQVATIVKSMKEFSYQGSQTRTLVDINRALETTAVVATGEWRKVAEIDWQLDEELPQIYGVGAELNQVFLNLVVNAAHAVAESLERNGRGKGRISVVTEGDAAGVTVTVADDGVGIPESLRDQIFDPFFTTKDVGAGTGQGLTVARSIVVEHHGGTIDFCSEVGVGTSMKVWLPIGAESMSEQRTA